MKKLAIISTHPIQYNAPWFQLLAARQKVAIKVFYTWSQAQKTVKDKTFGRDIQWDIPLLEGYAYEFIKNTAKQPGSHHFFGIDNPGLIKAIEAYAPDAVLVFGWNFKSHLKVMRHFKGNIPVWFRGDSTLLDETPGFKTLLRRQVLRRVYGYVDKALYVGKANKAYFSKHGLKPSQLIYAPHAIDNARFAGDTADNYNLKAAEWRKDLGYNPSDVVVLYAGKLEGVKQPELLIDAVIQANRQREQPLKLLLVGNGPLEASLNAQAKSYDFITFIPFQNQSVMPVVYRLGNVFCLPSKRETWGLAVNEAMATGRSVVVSNKVGCAQDLVADATGWQFAFNDPEALPRILVGLDFALLKQKGNEAAQFIKKWSFEQVVQAIEKTCTHVTEK